MTWLYLAIALQQKPTLPAVLKSLSNIRIEHIKKESRPDVQGVTYYITAAFRANYDKVRSTLEKDLVGQGFRLARAGRNFSSWQKRFTSEQARKAGVFDEMVWIEGDLKMRGLAKDRSERLKGWVSVQNISRRRR